MRPSLTTLALLSFASLPQEAAADAPAPTPAVDGRGLTALPGSVASDAPWRVAALPSTDGPSWSVVSTTEWSRRPLAQAHADGTHGVVLEELLVEELGLGWRPLPRLTIAALMPWAAMAEGPSSQRVVGVAGDLRLGAQVALWNTGGAGGPTVGVQPWAALPTGAPGVSLGTGEVSYGAAALVAQKVALSPWLPSRRCRPRWHGRPCCAPPGFGCRISSGSRPRKFPRRVCPWTSRL